MRRLGVDAIAVARMEAALRRSGPRFLQRSFTPAEIEYCAGRVERFAGRWAAKEAIIKSFDGSGICFPRSRIEVLPSGSGAPQVTLKGDSRGAHVQVTITHDGAVAVAAALLELPDRPPSEDGEPAATLPPAFRLPDRPADGHKGTFGTVAVIAGSRGFTGAAFLSSTAAARIGAGMVRLLVAESIYPILAVKCTEVMATPVPEVSAGAIGRVSRDAILRHLEGVNSVVMGPGLGRDGSTWRLVHELAVDVKVPMVLDADALNALADQRRLLKKLPRDRVLTPHPGEMSRLLNRSIADVEADRVATARHAASEWGAVVLLKGAHTVVAEPGGQVSVDPHEVPALASGGTGDVLSGIIGGLLAQGLDPFTAAVTGVYVHAEAGRAVSARQGDAGLLASDLLPELPPLVRTLKAREPAA